MKGILSAVVICLICGGLQAAEPQKKQLAKKAADAVIEATRKGDVDGIINSTYEPVIAEAGGREQMIEAIRETFRVAKVVELTAGEPGEFHVGGKQTYVVVPTSGIVQVGKLKASLKSYLLGISSDDGTTWKFVDGMGITEEEERKKFLPNLPESLKLPVLEEPKIVE
jgi:hypothetical protein